MSKLFKLKEWLTIAEAATHFSSAFGEQVEKKDIFRLALDGHLKLSVNLVNFAKARIGTVGGLEDAVYYDSPSIFTPELLKRLLSDGVELEQDIAQITVLKSLKLSEDKYINLDDEIITVGGTWDLSMWGAEQLDLEHEYQMLTDGPAVTLETIEGVFLQRGNQVCQLQESFEQNEFEKGSKASGELLERTIIEKNISKKAARKLHEDYRASRAEYLEKRSETAKENDYYPMGGLPNDAVYVVKSDEVLRFLSSLGEDTQGSGSSLGARERNTLLVLLATMCDQANFDYNQRGISKAIEAATEEMGARVSDDTIRKVLSQIPAALESRNK
ncbi:hypothetical protein [Arenicella xantha]|uniref:Uncharacterized protein n=1 Tax=Arenicella xantha TaxID=644221 RepID=A0A395JMC8_9GAMM|nr:hypothetical protein [Arenicella xantha]RBP50764.1 hypothetical protein DFR28_102176 [Arenicella xantha]